MKIGKYEFNSKEQAKDKIQSLGVDEDGNPTHKHTVVELGYLIITPATFDEDGNVITEAIYNDKYSVDVLWYNEDTNPYGWATYQVNVNGEGSHSYLGVNYQENKI